MITIEELYRENIITDLDFYFARFISRLSGSSNPYLSLAAALVSNKTVQTGDVCLDLHEIEGQVIAQNAEASFTVPKLDKWLPLLLSSSVVGRPGDFTPLVLDDEGRLYLYRYWEYEKIVSDDLKYRAANDPEDVNEELLTEGLNRLFPGKAATEPDWQKIALAIAVLKRFSVISGGPGTGKTSTAIRLLALLQEQSGGCYNIGIAAPTGKAAVRLQEMIINGKEKLPVPDRLKNSIPNIASTIHRLLGTRPNSVYFKHNKEHPLPLDVLIVDEASMVDLALMAKLLDALHPDARLILLGDKDQLASVEAGRVLGDICAFSGYYSSQFRDKLKLITGENIPDFRTKDIPGIFADSIVLLSQNYRFGRESGIGHLADLVNAGKGKESINTAQNGGFNDLIWRELEDKETQDMLLSSIFYGYKLYLELVRKKASPSEIFKAFNSFRVLCARRTGSFGVDTLNRVIEKHLHINGLINSYKTLYTGQPVMITVNDYNLKLFNGDIGIVMKDPDKSEERPPVFFIDSNGDLRSVSTTRLPEHETAYAMTVHKSQGSEFDHVLLVLPDQESLVLTRELIYTGITRAKSRLEIAASTDVFRKAVEKRFLRSSGLREKLWGAGKKI